MKLMSSKQIWMTVAIAIAIATSFPHAQATPARKEILQSCTQEAVAKELVGNDYADFMKGCLKPPQGAKPQTFGEAEPRSKPLDRQQAPSLKYRAKPAASAASD